MLVWLVSATYIPAEATSRIALERHLLQFICTLITIFCCNDEAIDLSTENILSHLRKESSKTKQHTIGCGAYLHASVSWWRRRDWCVCVWSKWEEFDDYGEEEKTATYIHDVVTVVRRYKKTKKALLQPSQCILFKSRQFKSRRSASRLRWL